MHNVFPTYSIALTPNALACIHAHIFFLLASEYSIYNIEYNVCTRFSFGVANINKNSHHPALPGAWSLSFTLIITSISQLDIYPAFGFYFHFNCLISLSFIFPRMNHDTVAHSFTSTMSEREQPPLPFLS